MIENGHEMMAHVVGTGCMAASVIGTFAAVEPDHGAAATAGLVCFEVAGELAAEQGRGPAAFRERLFDHAFRLTGDLVRQMAKVRGGTAK